jgi:predicted component of type VI protein secretion system
LSLYGKLSGHEEQLHESVVRNLESVLNSKRGYSAAVEVYGLGRADGYFAARPLVDGVVKDMLEAIRAYEPRLTNPSLTLNGRDHDLWVNFDLKGMVGGARCLFTLQFHCVFRNVRVCLVRHSPVD